MADRLTGNDLSTTAPTGLRSRTGGQRSEYQGDWPRADKGCWERNLLPSRRPAESHGTFARRYRCDRPSRRQAGQLPPASGPRSARTGPSRVTAIVCSKWALGLPSAVAWVQWSRQHLHPLRAHVHHRLDGDHQPRLDAEVAAAAQAAAEEIRHLRIFVHLPADAVADEALDRRVAVVADVAVPSRGRPGSTCSSCASARSPDRASPRVTSSSRCTSGAIRPTG